MADGAAMPTASPLEEELKPHDRLRCGEGRSPVKTLTAKERTDQIVAIEPRERPAPATADA